MSRIVFEITQDLGSANREFRDQIRKSARAAAPLIAEGFARFTTRAFVHYLRMARGELAEVQTHLRIAEQNAILTTGQLARAWPLANRAMGTTTNLLKPKLRQLHDEKQRQQRANRRRPNS